jgi:ABC-type proline/glycine betaine transport system permease subunit
MADPSPQHRADYLVRKLEEFIREGKTERGMSFRTWQALARVELTNAFADLEQRQARQRADLTMRRILIVGAASLVTIGFWGAVLTVDRRYGQVSAVLLTVAGLVLAALLLELGLKRALNRLTQRRRKAVFGRIEDFDRQLKTLEAEIRRRAEAAKAKADNPP